jgi:polyhydroxybutyrate depolymerase
MASIESENGTRVVGESRGVAFTRAPVFLLAAALLASCGKKPSEIDRVAPAPAPSPVIARRPYAMYVPPRHEARAPLLVFLHGFGGNHEELAARFGLEALADEHGFFVALPDGTMDPTGRRFWNASDGCCNFHGMPVDDVAYLDGILDDALAGYAIDPAHLYVGGYSNGGFMAHRYACERAERIAAIVSLAGEPWNDASLCKPRMPVSVLQIHGDADEVIPYGGATGPAPRSGGPPARRPTRGDLPLGAFPAAKDGVAMWSRLDGCGAPSTTDDPREEVLRYAGCSGATDVSLWTLHGAGHGLDRSRVDVERVWAFLVSHARE